MQEKLEHSDKERKDLLMFYQRFESLKETVDQGFSTFILAEKTDIKLNNNI